MKAVVLCLVVVAFCFVLTAQLLSVLMETQSRISDTDVDALPTGRGRSSRTSRRVTRKRNYPPDEPYILDWEPVRGAYLPPTSGPERDEAASPAPEKILPGDGDAGMSRARARRLLAADCGRPRPPEDASKEQRKVFTATVPTRRMAGLPGSNKDVLDKLGSTARLPTGAWQTGSVPLDLDKTTVVVVDVPDSSWCPSKMKRISAFAKRSRDFLHAMRAMGAKVVFASDGLPDPTLLSPDERSELGLRATGPRFVGEAQAYYYPPAKYYVRTRPQLLTRGTGCRAARVVDDFKPSALISRHFPTCTMDYQTNKVLHVASSSVDRERVLFAGNVAAMAGSGPLGMVHLCGRNSVPVTCFVLRDLIFNEYDEAVSSINAQKRGQKLNETEATLLDMALIEQQFGRSVLAADIVRKVTTKDTSEETFLRAYPNH